MDPDRLVRVGPEAEAEALVRTAVERDHKGRWDLVGHLGVGARALVGAACRRPGRRNAVAVPCGPILFSPGFCGSTAVESSHTYVTTEAMSALMRPMLLGLLGCVTAFAPNTLAPRRMAERQRSAVLAISMETRARIEFQPDVPELTLPTVSCIWSENLTVASFTFTNASSYPKDLVPFCMGANDSLLLLVDLENVGTREQIEQLPRLHEVCAAAGIELRIYATSDDSRHGYATHVVTPAGLDAVDTNIIWDASRYVCMNSYNAKEYLGFCSVLVVTDDHFGEVLASLRRPKGSSLWDPDPGSFVSSVTPTSELPPRWSGVLRAETLSELLTPRPLSFEGPWVWREDGTLEDKPMVEIPVGKGCMHLKDEEGSIVVPAFPSKGSSDENAELSVKSVYVARGSDEVARFHRFMERSGLGRLNAYADHQMLWKIFDGLGGGKLPLRRGDKGAKPVAQETKDGSTSRRRPRPRRRRRPKRSPEA